jgi:hypothetical protein
MVESALSAADSLRRQLEASTETNRRLGGSILALNEAVSERARRCASCNDTGVIETGNNDLPCDCPAGGAARFNVAGVGNVSGEAVRRHYLNSSPEPRPPAATRKRARKL